MSNWLSETAEEVNEENLMCNIVSTKCPACQEIYRKKLDAQDKENAQ